MWFRFIAYSNLCRGFNGSSYLSFFTGSATDLKQSVSLIMSNPNFSKARGTKAARVASCGSEHPRSAQHAKAAAHCLQEI
jgi:hypothetical protein